MKKIFDELAAEMERELGDWKNADIDPASLERVRVRTLAAIEKMEKEKNHSADQAKNGFF